MRPANQRILAKMAAGSETKNNDVFLKTKADKKVIRDLAESAPVRTAHVNNTTLTANHTENAAVGSISKIESNQMGLSQPDFAKSAVGTEVYACASDCVDAASGTTSAKEPSSKDPDNKSVCVGEPGNRLSHTFNGRVVQVYNRGAPVGSGAHKPQSTSTGVDNGPVTENVTTVSTTSNAIIQTTSTSLISPATVTLTRPPMPTCTAARCATSTGANRTDSQSGAHGTASSVTTGSATPIRSPVVKQNPRNHGPSTIAVTPTGEIRAVTPKVLTPRFSQPQKNVQNIQIPAGMVLVRSESGQLLMIHQQTLAQMQTQAQSQSAVTPPPSASCSTSQIKSPQASQASLLARVVTPTTFVQQGSAAQTTLPTTSTLQKPPVLQNPVILGGNATTLEQIQRIPNTVQPASAIRAQTPSSGFLGATGNSVTPTAITPISAETLQNVKKCRDFLSTLIKLVSSKNHSSETIANVKKLIKNLLVAKLEPEEFTTKLYKELNSSPQPCLVPFLKRSLQALRQLTPDADAFIQQSLQPRTSAQPSAVASSSLTTVVMRPPLSPKAAISAATSTSANKTTIVTVSQPPYSKPGMIVTKQQGVMVNPQGTLAQSSIVTLRGPSHSRINLGQPPVVKQLNSVKQTLGANSVQVVSQTPLQASQKNKMQQISSATLRDDDDINDVASMAGINLSEESARILATNSRLVGAVTRSCKDEAFLSTYLLSQRALEIGINFGVQELGVNVVNYIAHAAQFRLQSLMEKVSQVAQQKNSTFKEDKRHEQVTEVRTQLKFFEQLDQLEKQKKEELEREILLKAAKSRSRQEDPEQLRLKQKAKEMQQQELAQIMQREANLTALAAIGPRKKRKMDSPLRASSAEGVGLDSSPPRCSGRDGSRQLTRQRITRVNLRDLLFCLENERSTGHSCLRYKAGRNLSGTLKRQHILKASSSPGLLYSQRWSKYQCSALISHCPSAHTLSHSSVALHKNGKKISLQNRVHEMSETLLVLL
ncbi:transcription initiation factor TFIID subunit 4-like isoform X2 [Nerophis ophidion]|uniref:transcription initiation factor TFIID subunit 4-like isoform X2 n=1 Tax=Nerophis ophidion TaxID=159077 RepID=UPI002AE010E3|nr:transcription initiation factor TFIID subunit 4-like isoform X2 [Nerophis ophidion]